MGKKSGEVTAVKLTTKILIVLCGLWMAFIFFLSAQRSEVSTETSDKVTAAIVETMYGDKTPSTPEDIGFEGSATWVYEDLEAGLIPKDDIFGRSKFVFKNDVRKLAHIFIYLVLAVLVNTTFISHFRKNGFICIILTAGICTLYAASDEIHQYFVPGRSCEIRDMVIDFSGAVLGCAAYLLIRKIIQKNYLEKEKILKNTY